MVELLNGNRNAEWRLGRVAIELREWQNGGNGGNGGNGNNGDNCSNGGNGSNGGMAEWRNGGMEGTEWSNGTKGYIRTIYGTHQQ